MCSIQIELCSSHQRLLGSQKQNTLSQNYFWVIVYRQKNRRIHKFWLCTELERAPSTLFHKQIFNLMRKIAGKTRIWKDYFKRSITVIQDILYYLMLLPKNLIMFLLSDTSKKLWLESTKLISISGISIITAQYTIMKYIYLGLCRDCSKI